MFTLIKLVSVCMNLCRRQVKQMAVAVGDGDWWTRESEPSSLSLPLKPVGTPNNRRRPGRGQLYTISIIVQVITNFRLHLLYTTQSHFNIQYNYVAI